MIDKFNKLFVLAILLTFPQILGAKEFKLSVLTDYPPYTFYTEEDGWQGYTIDIAQRLIETPDNEHQLKLVVDAPWVWAMKSLRKGNLDFLWEVSYTEERTEFIEYIGITAIERMKLLVLDHVPFESIDTLDDFVTFSQQYGETPIQIVLGEDLFLSEEYEQRLETDPEFARIFRPDSFYLSIYDDNVWPGMLVALGRIHASINTETDALAAIEQSAKLAKTNPNIKPVKALPIHAFGNPPTYIVSPKVMEEKYKKLLKDNYQQARADGSFEAIWRKWFNNNELPPNEIPYK